jgi:hypothetical protein
MKSKNLSSFFLGKDKFYADAGDAEVIEAPTDRGIFMFRLLIKDEDKINELINIQKQVNCSLIK